MDQRERVMSAFTASRSRITAYAYAILRDFHAVDDVVQEAVLVFLRKADDWQPERPFLPWALTIVRYQAMNFLRAQQRRGPVLDTAQLDRLASRLAEDDEQDRDRLAALARCMEQAGEHGARLLRQKYCDGLSAEQIAERQGDGVSAIDSRLQRLRAGLQQCMERRLAGGLT